MNAPLRLVWLAIAATSTSVAQADIAKTLTPLYTSLNEAVKRNDDKAITKWVRTHTTPDFKYVSTEKSTYDRKGFIEGMVQQVQATQRVLSSTFKIQKVTGRGNSATLTVSSNFVGMVMLTGAPAKLVNQSTSNDLWVRTGNVWKLKSILGVKDSVTINGRKL
jgi:hypothetical protein